MPWLFGALALAAALWGPAPGLTWDEPNYCVAGYAYLGGNWAPNHEHPPLGKLPYGAMIRLDRGRHGILAPARLASPFLFAGLVLLTARAGTHLFGATAGLLAGLALVLMPQVLAHAHLAALDLPMALAWMGVACYSLSGKRPWLLGLFWGLALLTKVNGAFLLVPMLAWGLGSGSLKPRQVPVVIGAAVLVFFAGWPWLWEHTLTRLQEFFLRQTDRWIVPTLYLEKVYDKVYPPWHYPLVMAVVTMPPAFLAAALAGGWASRRSPGRLWLALHLAFTLGLACLPGVPRYDGVRLFLPAFPFVAICAGLGLDLLLRRLRPWMVAALLLAAVAPTALRIDDLSPCLLSYYSPLVGGLKGAERLGLETTFWGDALTPDLLSRAHGKIAVAPMGEDYLGFLRADGKLRGATRWASPEEADVLLMIGRKGMLSPALRKRFETEPAAMALEREGVALAKVYLRTP